MNTSNESYSEKLIKFYKPNQDNFIKNLEPINTFQRNMEFKEFNNIMITCLNANTDTVKYLKQKGINYENTSFTNKDRALIVALEQYFYTNYLNALKEFYDYVSTVNTISDKITEKLGYKLYDKLPFNQFTKYYKNNYTEYIKKQFINEQVYVNNFKEIDNNIYNFDFDNQIIDIISCYLPILLKDLKKNKLLNNEIENYKLNLSLLYGQVNRIKNTLSTIHLDHLNNEISEYANKIVTEDIKESKILINKKSK